MIYEWGFRLVKYIANVQALYFILILRGRCLITKIEPSSHHVLHLTMFHSMLVSEAMTFLRVCYGTIDCLGQVNGTIYRLELWSL